MKPILRITLWAIAICALVSVAALLWWWFRGDHTVLRATDAFTVGGVILLVIGLMSSLGGFRGVAGQAYQHARSAGSACPPERNAQDAESRRAKRAHTLALSIAGSLTMGIGGLIYWIAG
jgi:amino acid transporter